MPWKFVGLSCPKQLVALSRRYHINPYLFLVIVLLLSLDICGKIAGISEAVFGVLWTGSSVE